MQKLKNLLFTPSSAAEKNAEQDVLQVKKSQGAATIYTDLLKLLEEKNNDPVIPFPNASLLSSDMILEIFSYLTARDLLDKICLANKEWYKLVQHNELWIRLIRVSFGCEASQVEKVTPFVLFKSMCVTRKEEREMEQAEQKLRRVRIRRMSCRMKHYVIHFA